MERRVNEFRKKTYHNLADLICFLTTSGNDDLQPLKKEKNTPLCICGTIYMVLNVSSTSNIII